jgi:hypothetical protein
VHPSRQTIVHPVSPNSSTRLPRRITDGDDPDWASWYASWLLDPSELPEILGVRPVRSHLVHALVQLDRDDTATQPADRWEDW